MLKNMSIKLQVTILGALGSLLMGAFIIFYVATSVHNDALKREQINVLNVAKIEAGEIEIKLDKALDIARTLANALSVQVNSSQKLTREQVNEILKALLIENANFTGVFTLWEPNAFDGEDSLYIGKEGHDSTGRYIPYISRGGGGNIALTPLKKYEKEGGGRLLFNPKKN